jgi:hypothetical protein
MKNWLALGFAVSVLTAGSALAESVTTSPPSNPSPPQTASQPASGPVIKEGGDPELDKVICKKVDVPGTRIGGKKVCKTKREWNQIQRDTADAVRSSQDAGLRNNPTSAGGN